MDLEAPARRDNDLAARTLYNTLGADWVEGTSPAGYTEALCSLLLDHIRPGDRVLDICCGYGRLTIPLLRLGVNIRGVDLSEVLLARGQELIRRDGIVRQSFLLGNMKALPLAGDAFDFGFCVWASFNFLVSEADQLQALAEMRRILKRGGKALIEGPFYETHAPVQVVCIDGVTYEYAPWTIDDIRDLGKRAGLECEAATENVAGRTRALVLLHKR